MSNSSEELEREFQQFRRREEEQIEMIDTTPVETQMQSVGIDATP